MRTKKQITLFKQEFHQNGEKFLSLHNAHLAMDEYAAEKSIAFALWVWDNYPIEIFGGSERLWYSAFDKTAHYNITQLYEIFKDSINE